ncbi:MAG: hypothetical protein KC503_45185 [Myxococcales bacterium]|nr:hypothetical protein [Myxococcales bacterium]
MKTQQGINFVETADVRRWLRDSGKLRDYTRRIGQSRLDGNYLEQELGLPLHLRFVIERLSDADPEGEVEHEYVLSSIPFYSLCTGLFLPLSGMQPDKTAYIFGLETDAPPMAAEREQLLATFVEKDVGLTLVQKLACILGDPFLGRPSTFRRDSLVRLLLSMVLRSRREMVDRLTIVGEVAVLFAESRPTLKQEPPLTAAEVLETLRLMPAEKRLFKFDILRSLFDRCGKLEAYFLARLILRKAGFGFDYQGPLIARKLAEHFGAREEQVAHAMALTDAFHVARILADEGPEGLRKVQLQPLVPVRPALATGSAADVKKYPVWVERKYDGIRLMLHKSTDSRGGILCGAYTRTRGDWLEQIPGIDYTIKSLPCRNCIVDGELYGTVLDVDRGSRPASVYDVFAMLQGERPGAPLNLKFAAFDLIYLNGEDLTQLPLSERRRRLQMLLAPTAQMPLPVPISLSEGQLAKDKDDVNRLYQHFRHQGYEGIIAKDLDGPYLLSSRDPTWLKRKPMITLDLVVLAAVFAVTTKERAGLFGSYVIGARTKENTFEDVGDVAGVDRVRDAEIQTEIMREGLITGRRIERQSASGVRPGLELKPHLVITVRFEGITRDYQTQVLSLRDPKLVHIRSDKTPLEASTVDDIEEIFLRQRVG